MKELIEVYIAHPGLTTGGSEARVLYGLTALNSIGDVTLLTGLPLDLNRLNIEYQTNVNMADIKVVYPGRVRRILSKFGTAARLALFNGFTRSYSTGSGICVGAYNLIGFEKPAIQFVADFSFDDKLRLEFDPPSVRTNTFFAEWFRKAYVFLVARALGQTFYTKSDDWVIANSHWTANKLKERMGVICKKVIYPPVLSNAPDVPWEDRRNSFICLGRISHEKKIERVIDILKNVRVKGCKDICLYIVGDIKSDSYGDLIRSRISENSDWCFEVGPKWGREKFEFISQFKWAIHGRDGEAFGIAVAEQVRSGCIPFVPASGGPAEIVDHDFLSYSSDSEAVDKICSVLGDVDKQNFLIQHLRKRAELFSAERFMNDFKETVIDFYNKNK